MHTMLITDGSFDRDRSSFRTKLLNACQSGIDCIQLREKQLSCREQFELARELRSLTMEYGVRLLINEHADIALAVNADGIHLPEEAAILKTPLLIGKSVHSIESARQAQQQGAAYILFGPVFEPLSKKINQPPQGLEKFQQIVKNVQIPVIAVGGITPANVHLLKKSGASGIAGISSFLHAPDIAANIASFKAQFIQNGRIAKPATVQGLYVLLSSFEIAFKAIQGGADAIQFRHKGTYTFEKLETARKIRSLCRSANIPFIVNDRCDIALELEADGIHLGQDDMPISMARKLLGPKKIIGATASTVEQALTAEAQGADYVCMGHIYPTSSKAKDYPPLGLGILKKTKEQLKIPLLAIGGISIQNALTVILQGVQGIGVISAIEHSSDPIATTKHLKKMLNDGKLQSTNFA